MLEWVLKEKMSICCGEMMNCGDMMAIAARANQLIRFDHATELYTLVNPEETVIMKS